MSVNKYQEVRNYFPYLKTGKIYFNHAAIGPIPTPAINSINEYLNYRSELYDGTDDPYSNISESAKNKLAHLLNVNSNYIAWVDNISNAMSILAQGIEWKKGDRIILNDIEFPANIYPFLNVKESGVEIDFAKSENGTVDLPQIEMLVTPRTKLIVISFVQFLTGYRANLKTIGEFCKRKNIIFCVDGIQGVGAARIDVKDCSIDFFAGGTQKWLMGLQGLSYFYISPNLLNKIKQKFVGWNSVKDAWNFNDYNLILLEDAKKFENGTLAKIGIVALNASLNIFNEIGSKNIETSILDNSEYFINLLIESGFEVILKNVERKNLSGIITLSHKNSNEIIKELLNKKIICSVRQGMLRLSPHFYNTKEEIELVVKELQQIKN